METRSRALQENIEEFSIDVEIDPKYRTIQDVMAKYEGLQKPLNTFLEELCHPRKNWQFITGEARTFSLGYFYDLKTHPRGAEAFGLYVKIAVEAITHARSSEVKTDAFSNLYLLLQKFIKESGPELDSFLPGINRAFTYVADIDDNTFDLIAKSYYQLDRLASALLNTTGVESDFSSINSLMTRYYRYTYDYWLNENDPLEWLKQETEQSLPENISGLFQPLSHDHINKCRSELDNITSHEDSSSAACLKKLLALPGYGRIVDLYRDMPENIFNAVDDEKLKHQYKLVFLFHSMNISGLSSIHEDTLREINNMITRVIESDDPKHAELLIEKIFGVLHDRVDTYPDTVLKTVLNTGKGVYQTDESDLVNFFNQQVVRLGFQTPDFSGISDDWQIRSNPAHVQNIRTWMELIRFNPKWSKNLLSSLIIHLSINGVLIKDTDLFPRDITSFLNGNLQYVYNLAKQLLRLFPTYFNEIGAEGELRDISTRIDEICKRKDILVHFLRKQSHVESSNKIVSLMEATFNFWKTTSKEELKAYLPPDIYGRIEEKGPYIDGVSKIMRHIFSLKGMSDFSDLLTLGEEELNAVSGKFSQEHEIDIERVMLSISFYRLLNQKYCVTSSELEDYITQVEATIPLRMNDLREVLPVKDRYKKISGLLDFLEQLKAVILCPEEFQIREDIYRKRHIAADIPSMYGSYHEAKFDAMGLTFRIEAMLNTLFEELIDNFDLSFITQATFRRIYDYLTLFSRAMHIDGIPAKEFESQLDLLKKSMSIQFVTFTQFLDVFRGFTLIVRNLVSDYFNSIHHQNLWYISVQIDTSKLLPKYASAADTPENMFHKISEIFLRDTISSSLGMQRLDLFLTRILHTLHEEAERLPPDKHYMLVTYNPREVVTSLTEPYEDLNDIIHLGNKSLNIIKMKNLGLPVPSGFVITTEFFRFRELIDIYEPAHKNFTELIDREISRLEKQTGMEFGSPDNALLVSVRSGSAISQPGMLDSYLNVGINEDIVNGIINKTGQEWFAWDCYRRFLQSYGMSFGITRNEFDSIIEDYKRSKSVLLKKDLAPGIMKEVSLAYKSFIQSKGIELEESPKEQLYIAVQRVLNSWDSSKAKSYRRIMGISDDWGTAVTVQTMVFGNLSQESGSGVLFTHSPRFSTDKLRPWGDYTIGNQGEDVVSGLVVTHPVSKFQAVIEKRSEETSLENRFPEIYSELRDIAKILVYENQWAPQDIEFTFEGPERKDLRILQTRDMEMRGEKSVSTFESASDIFDKFLGHGIGVSGGALSGRTVFDLDDIRKWKEREPETPLLLIRGDTVPDDINEISAADGLLTARGGATSHAAIVANRLNKTCVVGCRDLVCLEKEKKFILHGKEVQSGDFISINGSEGSIFLGKMKVIDNIK
jgi:pyruvate,orthophosphate dikinase